MTVGELVGEVGCRDDTHAVGFSIVGELTSLLAVKGVGGQHGHIDTLLHQRSAEPVHDAWNPAVCPSGREIGCHVKDVQSERSQGLRGALPVDGDTGLQ